MNNRKKVLYLSYPSRYLCDDIFTEILHISNDFEHIYLDSEYKSKSKLGKINKERYVQKMKEIYDRYVYLYSQKTVDIKPSRTFFLKTCNTIININNRRKWVKEFLRQIEIIKPDIVLCVSDYPLNSQIFAYYFPETPILIVQPAARWKRSMYNLSKSSKRNSILGFFKNKIFFPYSNDNKKVKLNTFRLVWNDFWLNSEMRKKYPNIRVVGSIPFDIILKNKQISTEEKKATKISLCIPVNRTVILIALNKKQNIGEKGFLEFIEIYKEVVLINPNFFFILKVHPVEDEAYITSLFKTIGASNYIVIKKIPIKNLIGITDIFITHWSTTLYEAMAGLIPVILLNPKNQYDFSLMCLDNYNAIASCFESLSEYIQKANNYMHENDFVAYRNQFIEEQMLSSDGNSANRVVQVIRDVLSKKMT